MARRSRQRIDGASVALAIYAVFCCAVTLCLALGLYELMQPSRIANPGLAAYKPPGTVINLVVLAPPEPPPEITAASVEAPAQTVDISAPQHQTKSRTANPKPERPKRQRAARLKQWREPVLGYAFQPSFGSYRSW
jgi:hypothetical protein